VTLIVHRITKEGRQVMVKKNVFTRQGEEWTKEEVRFFKKIYRNHPNSYIADLLNRSVKAVERKAEREGLYKTKKYLRSIGRNV